MNNEIERIFVEKMQDVTCLSFYKGSKPLSVEKIANLTVSSIHKGDFHDGFNYSIHGCGEFFISTSDGCLQSNGAGEHFETQVKVENEKIIAIDRIYIKTNF